MASFGHVAVGMALGRAWAASGDRVRAVKAMASFSALALLPDLDVVAFAFGIPYSAPFGHRGATHSLAFAIATTVVVHLVTRDRVATFCALLSVGSHGLLDALTDGGLGAALAWPFSDHRIFFPWQPLPVAPIGAGMLSIHGARVMLVELAVFSPFLIFALWPRTERSPRDESEEGASRTS